MKKNALLVSLLIGGILTTPAIAANEELNIYSARHYQTDEDLYGEFTKQTGIKVNRIEAKEDELIERMRTEGENSPADIFITVDASRLGNADRMGLFAEFQSDVIDERIPENMRTPTWIAFSKRARVIIYNPELVDGEDVQTYADLADPKLKGKVCTRTGAHPYNLSLGSALIHHEGAEATEKWAEGIVANFARDPKGGDTDQIRSVAAGECGVAIANSYYYARLMNSDRTQDQEVVEATEFVWPNQETWGTHVNVSGAGIVKTAPNKEAAQKFLEYLTSDSAQAYFANGNNEWPVVLDVKVENPALEVLGEFKQDEMPISELANNVPEAQKIYDRAGYR